MKRNFLYPSSDFYSGFKLGSGEESHKRQDGEGGGGRGRAYQKQLSVHQALATLFYGMEQYSKTWSRLLVHEQIIAMWRFSLAKGVNRQTMNKIKGQKVKKGSRYGDAIWRMEANVKEMNGVRWTSATQIDGQDGDDGDYVLECGPTQNAMK